MQSVFLILLLLSVAGCEQLGLGGDKSSSSSSSCVNRSVFARWDHVGSDDFIDLRGKEYGKDYRAIDVDGNCLYIVSVLEEVQNPNLAIAACDYVDGDVLELGKYTVSCHTATVEWQNGKIEEWIIND